MNGVRVGFLVALLLCVPVILAYPSGPKLLTDSDTAFLLMKLKEYNSPLRWFTHDWPLENHFYRPISTLFFEWDLRRGDGSAGAFGFTNAVLCAFSALGAYWLACELFRSVAKALCAQALFVCWVLDFRLPFLSLVPWVVSGVVLIRILTLQTIRWSQIWLILAAWFIPVLLSPVSPRLSGETLSWIPGRTATSMTIFCLIAMASYLRFERLSGERTPSPAPSSTDRPATKSSKQISRGKPSWGWLLLSFGTAFVAMAAYEQAVMIPFVMIGLGFWLRRTGIQTRFAFQLGYWALLFCYVGIRLSVIPIQPSGYQDQQFRSGYGWLIDLSNYAVPAGMSVTTVYHSLSEGFLILLTPLFWNPLLNIFSNIGIWGAQRKQWIEPLILVLMATIAFAPMALLHQFGHYHFWPATLMACFAVAMLSGFWSALVSAVSRPVVQAPPRSGRAPGSLPRL